MDRREIALAPLLRPFHRTTERLRQITDEELLGVDLELAAESTADLRRDHAHLVLPKAEVERDDELHEVRDLRRRPERELARLELRGHGARLHRVRDEALVDDALSHFDLGVLERLVDVAALDRVREDEIGAELLVDDRRARFERLRRVDHHRKRLVVHRDQIRRSLRGVTRIRDDRGDRVARIPRFVGRDRHVLRAVHARNGDEHGQHARRLELGAREHRDDTGLLLGGGGVDPADAGVRVRTPHERHVRHALQHHVVGESPLTRDEARVLFACDARSDVFRIGGDGHGCTSAAIFASPLAA